MNREEVLKKIEEAFSGVALGEGIGMFEADAIDNYADDDSRCLARSKDREYWPKWEDIPDNEISKCYWILSFLDAEGMRFVLPAYMRFSVRHFAESESASIDSPIYALNRGTPAFDEFLQILSPLQKCAISRYLRYMYSDVGESYVDASVAKGAYEITWGLFDGDA